jgi:hypothetical protein
LWALYWTIKFLFLFLYSPSATSGLWYFWKFKREEKYCNSPVAEWPICKKYVQVVNFRHWWPSKVNWWDLWCKNLTTVMTKNIKINLINWLHTENRRNVYTCNMYNYFCIISKYNVHRSNDFQCKKKKSNIYIILITTVWSMNFV